MKRTDTMNTTIDSTTRPNPARPGAWRIRPDRWIAVGLAVALGGFAVSASEGAFQAKQVSADAKWLVHLDFDHLLKTRVGQFLRKELVENHLGELRKAESELNSALKAQGASGFGAGSEPFSFAAVIDRIRSVTAYGVAFRAEPETDGVLILNVAPELQQIAAALLVQQSHAGEEGGSSVRKVAGADIDLYSMDDDLMIGLPPGGQQLLIGKSLDRIKHARAVMEGKKPNLTAASTLSGYPKIPDGFFFFALAEGFAANKQIPPQARVLQQADGVRLVLGEFGTKLFLNLILKANDSNAREQIRQVVQGIAALISISQPQNRDLQLLTQSLKVGESDNTVSFTLQFPVQDTISRLETTAATMRKKGQTESGTEAKTKDADSEPDRRAASDDPPSANAGAASEGKTN